MKTLQLIAILMLVGLLTGCPFRKDKTPPPPDIVKVYVPYECGTPPDADKYAGLAVNWQVVQNPDGSRVYVLTQQQFKNLMVNQTSAVLVGKQVKSQRDFFAACIARSKKGTETPPK